ncbi:hypothetical protein EVAR_48043_1 [Eumeta japonica]|uniref:Uncharacterized protein n=1 Tax=Eumeta variegata TaxID=151549 RepID=A0A4C1XH03_EUMVA|nr:hypothetical protein EVAR_48043_1 [Eumeta japonica]
MSVSKKGKTLNSQARELICLVYSFMHEEFLEARKKPFTKEYFGRILERTSRATGVCRTTIRSILREKDRLKAEAAQAAIDDPSTSVDVRLKTPERSGRPKKSLPMDIDEYDIQYINYSIRKYYDEHKKTPRLTELLNTLKQELGYKGGKESLRRTLDILGLIRNKKIIYKEIFKEEEKMAAGEDVFAELMSPNMMLTDEKDPLANVVAN